MNMALIRSNIYSSALTTAAAMDLIIPLEVNEKERYPVLWLLTPIGRDQSTWHRRTKIEQLAEKHGVIVAMPGMGLSYGQDMHYGLKYEQMLTKELPAQINDYYAVDLHRQYIAGSEAGGFIAFQAALKNPEQYQGALCLSYGCITDTLIAEEKKKQLENAFGTDDVCTLKGTDKCLENLLSQVDILEKLYLSYGKKDTNAAAADKLASLLFEEHVKISPNSLSWNELEIELEEFMKIIK